MSKESQFQNSLNLPTALVAVDICIFKIINNELCVYLIDVENDIYKNKLCLPGGLIHVDEEDIDTLKRIIKTKTELNFTDIYTEQLYSFTRINRDKRSRVVSISYICLLKQGTKDIYNFKSIKNVKDLAYDHNDILSLAIDRVKSKLEYTNIIKKFINDEFTYSELQKTFELLLEKVIDKRNFRKKFDSLNVIEETGEYKKEGRMRPAKLYKFKDEEVKEYKLF